MHVTPERRQRHTDRPGAHAFAARLAVALACLPGVGHALTVHCVADAQQFSNALQSAAASSDTLVQIRMRQGNYDAFAATQPFTFTPGRSDQTVEISGGWSGPNGSCQSNAVDPALTRILGKPTAAALTLYTGASNATSGNQLVLRDLSISHPGMAADLSGACLAATVNPTGSLLVERVHLHDCVAFDGAYAAARFTVNGGQLTVRNVAAFNNLAPTGALAVNARTGGTAHLSQLTVSNSKSSGGQSSRYAGVVLATTDAQSSISLSNSVAWDNSGYLNEFGDAIVGDDILVSGPNIILDHVHRGSLYGTPAADLAAGAGDPAFASAIDPRPAITSVLVDAGIANPDGGIGVFDADGVLRVRGKAVDIGAFESPFLQNRVFGDGFD